MSPARQLDLHGSITGRDAAGRSFEVQCDGARIAIDSQSTRAAWAALSALKSARASAGVAGPGPLPSWMLRQIDSFEVELRIRGRVVGLAGRSARPTWLGRRLTRWPLELRLGALLLAALSAF